MSKKRFGCPFVCVVVLCFCFGRAAFPQAKQPQQSSAATTPSSLAGITVARDQWNDQITAPPGTKHDRILCYSLVMASSASLPYTLRPTGSIIRSNGDPVPCSAVDEKHPLMMDSILVIAIDARYADTTRIKYLNLNVTTASNSPISPNPIRPSFGAGTASSNLGDAIYFLSWPVQIQGDSTATLSLNAIYNPPAPGQGWQQNTLYPPGSIIVPVSNPDGHYYVSYNGGLSGPNEPVPWNHGAAITDGSCQWLPLGTPTLPTIAAPKSYALNSSFNQFDVIYVALTGQYFAETGPSCKSGTSLPIFAAAQGITPEQLAKTDGKTTDGGIQWSDLATYQIACSATSTPPAWQKATHYAKGDTICNPKEKGREYKVLVSPAATSMTGDTPPAFVHLGEDIYKINAATWTDLGQAPPTAVSNAPASDQTVALINSLPLPQSHSLYYYNLSSGVFITTIRNPSFGFASGTTPSTNTGTPIQTGSSLIIDPVISLTRYLKPIDAERRWRPSDLTPGVMLSFSLSSPTSNFYIGGTSEFQRYLQLDYGYVAAKISKLSSKAVVASSATTPVTTQGFANGAYIGISFNISGLIQSLTSGGGGGSSKSSSSSSSTAATTGSN